MRDQVQAARFAYIIASLDPSGSVLDRFCEASRLMLGAEGTAITVYYGEPQRHTASSTSTLALMIEEAQEVAGEGPGFEAARTGHVVFADFGASEDTPWLALNDCVAKFGFAGTVLALPITVHGGRLGVLVAHTFAPSHAFDAAAAHYLAYALGPVLLDHISPEALEAELTEDWSSRAVVHQATGMLIFDLRISAEDALALLRAHAYATDSTLLQVAVQVVDKDLEFDNLSMEGD
ncbi:ANTAR domain-containing protein [Aeromicrobium sp. SMF47]|uniref:ANTAR domain-containing protein n=1 Tax=Aeromicrobium yanjiei TaxID=2662028 RepID=UPI00129D5931|nr:ANTAR domain-containing protein [Aeromicrobium yanjiei]MRJ77415.1 ANTAR domain-containing protein [Aeromicrobium yanjiei]